MRVHLTLLTLLLIPACLSPAFGQEYYVLQGIDKTQPDSTVTAPGVDGFTIRVSWNKLHQEGFGWLDDQIARGNGLNTKIQLRVMAGKHAPANLPGVSYFEYLSTDESGVTELRRAPVPWDAAMRTHWQTLAAQLGARYGNNQRIEVVHVPSFADSSEMHMPDEVTLLPGYSSPVLAASWIAMADPLEAAFPQATLSLNYTTPTQSQIEGVDSSWLLDELALLAGNRAGYQANDLAADVSLDRNKYQTLIAQHKLGRSIGFQMVSSSETQRFGGSFLQAVAIGVEAGAEWLEIYAADVARIPRPGDYNLDGSVSAADFIVWRNSLGSTTSLFADGNGDRVVNGADYQVWRKHFGETSAASSASLPVLSNNPLTAVPEPAALLLALFGLILILDASGRIRDHRASRAALLPASTLILRLASSLRTCQSQMNLYEALKQTLPCCGLSLSCLVGLVAESSLSAEPERPIGPASAVERHGLAADEIQEFDVVIAGGSTAAFAAALASAESGARTALLEPTDWVGGQLTASGVPAIDEAWHTIRDSKSGGPPLNVAEIARNPANITPNFLAALQAIENPGDCWVSRFCFCPDGFLERQLLPLQRHAGDRLTVYLNTVVKHVELNERGSSIQSLTAIARTPKPGVTANGYDRLPSADLPDWYSPRPSERFDKRILKFTGVSRAGRPAVFIDATEWGEILALSGVSYLQGMEESDGSQQGNDRCGQATVFCFVEEFLAEPGDEPSRQLNVGKLGFGDYRDRADAWEKIWTYRRLRGHGDPSPGDLSLQNWGYSLKLEEGGNDYPFGYLFKSRLATEKEREDWRGGVDFNVMAAAEQRALAWHDWFKQHAPPEIDSRRIVLNFQVLGTGHGLAKLPYIRDTRRSIGLDGFLLKFADLSGPPAQHSGTRFADRIALGAYPADVHALAGCKTPRYIRSAHDTLPFYIPFRALTHNQLDNFLVAGKTMAQSFLANSATRLHPIEWSSGTAAGVAAAWMSQTGKTSREACASIQDLQALIKRRTPIEWTFTNNAP